jgi:hypothetical protein
MGSVKTLRRPQFSRRSVLYWVQSIANKIADEHGGKIADEILIKAQLKKAILENPERIDLDSYCNQTYKFWKRTSNGTVNARGRVDGILFVPGAFVSLGKRQSGRMRDLDPITDVTAWLNNDEEARKKFEESMDRRRSYQLKVIEEAVRNRDCPTLGDLEAKLRGYRPSADDASPFPEDAEDVADDADDV